MRVTVFGSARTVAGTPQYREAHELGRLLAERGDVIVSGGYGGSMEAVSRGAHEGGGQVVGVTLKPWIDRIQANPYVKEEISTRSLFERLEALVESDALVALPGGAGTLGEVALAWNLRQMDLMPHKLVILVGPTWRALVEAFAANLVINQRDLDLLTLVETVAGAVAALDTGGSEQGRWYG